MRSPHRVKKIKKIQRIRKWKKRSLIVLCSFVFLISFLLILLYTSLGVKIITGILERVMPEIRIEHASGALNDLQVEGFSLELNGVEVKVGKAALSLSGLCIIQGKICVKDLDAKDILVNVDTSAFPVDETKQEDNSIKKRALVSMPFPLELRRAELLNVAVNVDDMHFGLSSFQGRASWINEKIYVFSSEAEDVKAIFPDNNATKNVVNVSEPQTDHKPINEIINQIFNKPLIASLPEVNIPLDIYVNSLQGDNWLLHIGGEDYRFNNVAIGASTENNYINVRSVQTYAKTPYANGDVTVSGNITLGSDWPVSANVHAKTEDLKNQISTELDSQIKGKLLGTLNAKAKIKGLNNVEIDAQVNFIEHFMPAVVKIQGSHIQWPISGKAQYQLNDFDVDLSGLVNDYHLNAKGNAYGEAFPNIQFDMQSKGTNEFIDIHNVTASLPQGVFDLSGTLNWVNILKWNANINFKEIDLSQYIPDYPIRLDGQLKTNGESGLNYWIANLTDMQLKGDINEAPFVANGNLAINSSQFISADQFYINWGENIITLNGSTKNSNLVADLNLSNLNVIEESIRGRINGHMTVQGSINDPIVDSNLEINNFVWQEITLEHALLVGDIKYSDLIQGALQLKIRNLYLPNLSINDADIEFSGNERDHQLIVSVNGKPVSINMVLSGQLNKDWTNWHGSLSETVLAFNDNNRWQLNQPVDLSYDLQKSWATINAHCLVNNQSKVCLDKSITITDKGEATVSLSDIDLALFDVLTDGDTKLAGNIQGKVNIKWDPNYAIPSIIANIDSHDVYIKQTIASQVLPIPFDLFTINANINDKQANLDWKFSLKEFGQFSGNVKIDDPTDTKRLNGYAIIDNLSLSIINPLLDDNEHANGIINSHLKFSGTLLDPYVVGNLVLKHSEIKSTQLPADVQAVAIDINFRGKSSILKGTVQTKSGNIDIEGKADWHKIDNWHAYVTVKGAALEVTLPPMITMSVVPDIRIEADSEQLNLTGKVRIPSAAITVTSLPPSIVDVSSDEVMLDNNLQEISAQSFAMRINSRLLVSLGDKVSIDAFGLSAQLKGDVYVTQTNKGLSVNGQISIPSGRFQAYGQNLIVRKGEIIFAGPPDQPRLNIDAIRNPQSIENNVTAGIRVTGLADEPRVEVYSDPAMSQQEALSYLLRGQGLESGDQSDNDMITALLIGLGTAQGSRFIGDIGDAFGIKDLTLDTQGSGDNQKLVVSGYILPNLQLKYGVGIFDSLATFTLRYRLLPRLYLEAASGLDQTVDLIYQFEF